MMKTFLNLQCLKKAITSSSLIRCIRILVLALTVILLSALPAQRAQAANVYTVTNTNAIGTGSLYQAMQDAINDDAGPALIAFNIPKSDPGYGSNTSGVWTIRPTDLPILTVGAIVIDGRTQMTNQGDTNFGHPNVEIDNVKNANSPIFSIRSGYNTIQWLAINDSNNGIGVDIMSNCGLGGCFNPSGNYIQYNYIGTDATGTLSRPNAIGIEISGGAYGNWIVSNCIAGNSSSGIQLWNSGTDNNHIYNNSIGSCNYVAIPNGGHGIQISSGPQGTVVEANSIIASGMDGIYINSANSTTILSNSIGECGTPGCADSNQRNGIELVGGAAGTQIVSNSLWWNKWHGIWISDSGTSANVTGNYVGDSTLHGIAVYSGAQSTISNNEIWYSGWSGIAIVNSNNNLIQNNDVGVNRKVPNDHRGSGYYGVAVISGHDNTIGPGNMIAHNGLTTASDGIRIDGATALHNRMTQNSIFDNGGKGIALVNGGNAPVIAPVLLQANCQAVIGGATLNSIIEIFSDASNEGRYYEGATLPTSMTPWGWSGTFRGPNVTATATDSNGNTSEFSAPRAGACLKLYLPLVKK